MSYQTSFMPRPQVVSNGRPATPVVPIDRVRPQPPVVMPSDIEALRRQMAADKLRLEALIATLSVRLERAEGLLEKRPPPEVPVAVRTSMRLILDVVSEVWEIPTATLLSERRSKFITRPRFAAMWLMRELTRHSLPAIGNFFGGRDHTTIMHATQRCVELMDSDEGFYTKVKIARATIETRAEAERERPVRAA